MSFNIVYLGGEQNVWQDTLRGEGVTHVGSSYWSLRKRIPKRGMSFTDWGFPFVLLDSGGHAANKDTAMTVREWRKYSDEYADFAQEHQHEVSIITEFDCLAMGLQWIKDQREEVWSDIEPGKFVPVWHQEHGIDELNNLAARYGQVAISSDAVKVKNGMNMTPHLNALARDGVKLHGVAMTKPSLLREIQFTTASSTSWLSPTQFGDTQVFHNNALTRYPKDMKERARKRHETLFTDAGFDAALIQADDNTEVTRFSLWSWRQQEEAIQALWEDESNSAALPDGGGNAPDSLGGVATLDHDSGNAELVRPSFSPRDPSEMKPLPSFAIGTHSVTNADTQETTDLPIIEVRGSSPRRCDSCVIKTKCPEYKVSSTCAYELPVMVKDKEQKRALLDGMLAMQTQRVAFMRLVEEVNGGYADPNLSQEVDRLLKITNTIAELENGNDFFKVSISGRGSGGGVMSQLFGSLNAARAAPQPRIIEQADTDEIISRMAEGKRVT